MLKRKAEVIPPCLAPLTIFHCSEKEPLKFTLILLLLKINSNTDVIN